MTQVLKRVSRFQEEFRVVFLDEGGAGAQHDVRGTGEEEHNILISRYFTEKPRNRLLIESCERHILFQKYFSMFLSLLNHFLSRMKNKRRENRGQGEGRVPGGRLGTRPQGGIVFFSKRHFFQSAK